VIVYVSDAADRNVCPTVVRNAGQRRGMPPRLQSGGFGKRREVQGHALGFSKKCSPPCVLAMTVTPASVTVKPRLRSNSWS
jgi:hypothetical protein